MYGYIYKIIFPLNSFHLEGYPFYIGQKKSNTVDDNYYGSGRKVRDWFKSRGLNSKNCSQENILKLNIKKEILFIVEDSPNSQEILNNYEFIEINKYKDNSLCLNLRDGGNQGVLSLQTKQRISENTKKAMANPTIYQKYKEAHNKYYTENKEKVSELAKQRVYQTKNYIQMNKNNLIKNKKIWDNPQLHEERRQKMIKSNKNVKPILCIETGIRYDSIRHAKKLLNICHIERALKDPWRTAGGYHWQYITE